VVGSLAIGLFATKSVNPQGVDGLFYGGGAMQLWVSKKTSMFEMVFLHPNNSVPNCRCCNCCCMVSGYNIAVIVCAKTI
jgi:hypothetical protein